MKALFDTNILIDYLNGEEPAKHELGRYNHRLISLITWMEVLVGCRGPAEERAVRHFLSGFDLAAIDLAVSDQAVTLRRTHGMRLPDAIIWASAQQHHALLVTRNTKDFPVESPGVRIPYRL